MLLNKILLVATFFVITQNQQSSGQKNQQCNIKAKVDPLRIINPTADVFLTALLPIHEPDQSGGNIYSCGNITRDGVTTYEAIKWTLSTLNQDSGQQIDGKRLSDSFIPGIKLGVKVYDSCGHQEVAINHLIREFPTLSSKYGTDGGELCLATNSTSFSDGSILNLGILDESRIFSSPRIIEASMHHFLPIVPLDVLSTVPPDVRGRIVIQILRDLEWTRLAVIHAQDENSMHILKVLGQHAQTGAICMTTVQPLPNILPDGSSSSFLSRQRASGSVELRGFARSLSTLTSALSAESDASIPILVIGNGESISRLLRVMADNSEFVTKYQWFFSSMPSPEDVELLQSIGDRAKFYTLSPHPGTIGDFDKFWSQLATTPEATNDDWLKEFLMMVSRVM